MKAANQTVKADFIPGITILYVLQVIISIKYILTAIPPITVLITNLTVIVLLFGVAFLKASLSALVKLNVYDVIVDLRPNSPTFENPVLCEYSF